jgi:hypothetical protein
MIRIDPPQGKNESSYWEELRVIINLNLRIL